MAFPFRGTNSNRDIFDGSAISSHSVTLEVGQHQEGIVVRKVCADIVLCQSGSTYHRQCHRAVFIHNDHIGNGRKAVILSYLIVHRRVGAGASVGGVALHNGAVDLMHNVCDQGGVQIIAGGRFSCGELHGHISSGGPVQSLINRHQALRGDVCGHKDLGRIPRRCRRWNVRIAEMLVQHIRYLRTGRIGFWMDTSSVISTEQAVSRSPRNGIHRIAADQRSVCGSQGSSRIRIPCVPIQNHRSLLSCDRVAAAKTPIAVSGKDMIGRGPKDRIITPGAGEIIRKYVFTCAGRCTRRPVEDRDHHGAGHAGFWGKGSGRGSAHNSVSPAPAHRLRIPRFSWNIRKAGFGLWRNCVLVCCVCSRR